MGEPHSSFPIPILVLCECGGVLLCSAVSVVVCCGAQAWGVEGLVFGQVEQEQVFSCPCTHPMFSQVGPVQNRCPLFVARLGGVKSEPWGR